MRNLKQNHGFTLIELVVAIGILGVLAVAAIAALNPVDQFKKARDGQRKTNLAQMQRVLEQFYQDHGLYPSSNSSYQILDFNNNPVLWGGPSGWPPYMNLVPSDPTSSTTTYIYYSSSNGQKYQLYAHLERGPNDPVTCQSSVSNCINNPQSVQYCTCPNVPAGVNCGVSGQQYPCNFGVTSPNTSL